MKTQVLNLKSFVFIFLTVLLIFGMKGTVYGQKLNVGKPRTVRMIYFLPNDWPFRSDVVQEMKDKIGIVQDFYAEQMLAHGHGNRTFRVETNARGKPVVHRVNGQYPFSHYDNTLGNAVIEELEQAFDFNVNIYFIVLGADALRQGNGQPAGGVADQRGKIAGHLLVPNIFEWGTVGHELGHTFGLGHDFRDNSYLMSYGHQYSALSTCTAEFLSVHPYFNPRIPIAEVSPPIIELISSPTYPAGAKSIPVQLKVEDPNGVHQVQLFAWGGLQKCRGLAGKKETVIEFEYDGGVGLLDFDASLVDFTSLSDAATHNIFVNVVDTDGNVSKKHFLLREDSPSHIATLKIEGFLDDEVFTLKGAMAFSPNGTLLATAIPYWRKGRKEGSGYIIHPNHSIYLWNVTTQQNIATFNLGDRRDVRSMVFSPDGRTLTSLLSDGTIELWDVATKENISIMKENKWVWSHVLSPDGRTLASGTSDGTIELWDVATKENITTFKGHESLSLPRMAISPNGNFLAVAVVDAWVGGWVTDSSLHLWDVTTQRNIATLKDPKGFWSLAFSPDNTVFAAGTGNAEIKLWDMTTRKYIGDLSGAQNEIYSLAFSPDGTLLASASGGLEIKLWDVKTRMNITTLSGHMKPIPSVAFSPDGTLLASAGDDGLVMLWNVSEAIRDHGPAVTAHVTRPPMYWIDKAKGTLDSLVGPEVESLVPSVHNAISLAVDTINEKLYWAEKTDNRTGKIRRANLDGRKVQLVKDLTSVPLDIALDTVNRKIYLTNSWGKVQRLNFNGSNFQPNLITGLQTPNHLALDVTRGKIYWTEQTSDRTGKIRRANLDGTNVELVKDLTNAPRGIAVDNVNGKIYLANSYGKVQRLNLNGSNFQPNLITGLESLEGIAVEAVSRKLYWTEKGSISRANLNGKNIENIVTGLNSPANIALSIMSTNPAIAAAPAMLQGLPDATRLYPNYPNPFNPETWIPYQLSEPAEVTLHIYATDGRLIRTLALGHQPAGMYQRKNRAAYWDGKNEVGEAVASGVYFYTLTAGDFSTTRKMLIQK